MRSMMRILCVAVFLASYALDAAALGQDNPDDAIPSLSVLIERIEEGVNADHIKYRYLMPRNPMGGDRDAAMAQVRAAMQKETSPSQRILLQSVLAFGLTRGNDNARRQEGAALYVALLTNADWPATIQSQRRRVAQDFLGAREAIGNDASTAALAAGMFEDYLIGKPVVDDGDVFSALASTSWVHAKSMGDVIERLRPAHTTDRLFLARLGEYYLYWRRPEDATACFKAAWDLTPQGDDEIKRIGGGLVRTYMMGTRFPEAIAMQEKLLDRLVVKDDYIILAELHRKLGHSDEMKAALLKQLGAAPSPCTNVMVARVMLDAKLAEDAARVLAGLPTQATDGVVESDSGLRMAADVLRWKLARLRADAGEARRLQESFEKSRADFLVLSRKHPWLEPYYRDAVVLARSSQRR